MFDIQNYASFLIAILVFQLVPGPGTIAILDATARCGVRAFPYARRLATRLAGIALVGFGLKLAANNR
jgi:threonine/homoserine/homoserine lactone efflux protein